MGYDTRFSLRLRLFFFEGKLIKFLVSAFFFQVVRMCEFSIRMCIYIYMYRMDVTFSLTFYPIRSFQSKKKDRLRSILIPAIETLSLSN